ncbi:T9SS type A sorting domain-containing protein [Saprospira sp. CCB-QB6]|uniref:T9SS type A sorting domain-containing protein n=1 Tax=Saprospira sp. CCB-QB6 TaxID=3023936 RepID=UPI00234AD702|nr:T9SS type A sorting domain-containing protein [Saprospira sp. CCB-QB6]WCL80644.1 T9SS type A sorting domain-containing protein [Saprospira sp. CCB-QB6]
MKNIFTLLFLSMSLCLWGQKTISLANLSVPSALQEACPGHTIEIDYGGYNEHPDFFFFSLKGGRHRLVKTQPGSGGDTIYWSHVQNWESLGHLSPPTGGYTTDSSSAQTVRQGATGNYSGTITFQAPQDISSGTIVLYAVGASFNDPPIALDTIVLLATNPDINVSPIPTTMCTTDSVAIFVTPAPSSSGGTGSIAVSTLSSTNFTASNYFITNNNPTNPLDYTFVPNGVSGAASILDAQLLSEGYTIRYNYVPTMQTTGASCPAKNKSQVTTIYNNNIDGASFAAVTNREDSAILQLQGVSPTSFENLIINNSLEDTIYGPYVIDGEVFLASQSGIGTFPVTYEVENGPCLAQASANVLVRDVPGRVMPYSYCSLDTAFTFERDTANFPWDPTYRGRRREIYSRKYLMDVDVQPAACLTVLNSTVGQERYQIDPAAAPVGTDTIWVQIVYKEERIEYSGSGNDRDLNNYDPKDTLAILAYYEAIELFAPQQPVIDTTLQANYCNDVAIVALNSTPAGGVHDLITLTGPHTGTIRQAGNNFSPASLHQGEISDIRYRLIYESGIGNCIAYDTAEFTVVAPISLAFIGRHSANQGNGNNTYCYNDPSNQLLTAPAPTRYNHPDSLQLEEGSFSGPGIQGFGPVFNPRAANPGSFNIRYTYVNQYGCKSFVDSLFTVDPGPNPILSSDQLGDTYCANDTLGILTGSPAGGIFFGPTIQNPQDSAFQPNIIYAPPTPNTAGTVDFEYRYTDPNTGCSDTTSLTVTINPLPQPSLTVSDYYFCESDQPVSLNGQPAGGVFYYYNTTDTLYDATYYPNPNYPTLLTSTRIDTVVYELEALGCVNRTEAVLTTYPNPVFGFSTVSGRGDTSTHVCLGQDTLFFFPYLSAGQVLSYDGPGVLNNTDFLLPQVAGVGAHNVRAIYEDSTYFPAVCRDTAFAEFYVHSQPNVDFTSIDGCGTQDAVLFPDNANLGLTGTVPGTTTLYDSISQVVWDFGDGTIRSGTFDLNTNTIDTVHYVYPQEGVYTASLFVENNNYCSDSAELRILVLPAIRPTDSVPYFQDFEADAGGWIEEAEAGNVSSNLWEWGTSNANVIASGHGNTWITGLNRTYTSGGEDGWVYSPCIDMTGLERPMMSLDLYYETDPGNDGAVIEYFDEDLRKWVPLGEQGRGIEWYNYNVVAGRPGVQNLAPRGWSGDSDGWQDARYKLDDLMNYTNLRIRIAFGAIGVVQGLDGVAFDNVWIGNRSRNVLLEHFSNSGLSNFDYVNQHVYDLMYRTPVIYDAVMVQYQTSFPNANDRFNLLNVDDPSARVIKYGISQAGKALIDGERFSVTANSQDLQMVDFEEDMLQSPKFDINIDTFVSYAGNTLEVAVTFTALENMPLSDYDLHIAVLEDSLTYFSGEYTHSVMRKMLPAADGSRYSRAFAAGDQEHLRYTWTYPSDFDFNEASVVVFIQEETAGSKEVFQAISSRDITIYLDSLGTSTFAIAQAEAQPFQNLKLYPNPSSEFFNLQLTELPQKAHSWRVVDLQGRIFEEGSWEAGQEKLQLWARDWPAGVYIFAIQGEGFQVQRKMVLVR